MTTQSDKALDLLGQGGVMRPRNLRSAGVPNVVITRLLAQGSVRRVFSNSDDRVLLGYALAGNDAGPEDADHTRLAQIAVQHPQGVLCLQSALRYHRMTDEYQQDMNVAVLPGSTNRSSLEGVEFVQWSNPDRFRIGVVEVSLGGVLARITDAPRTVADLFQGRRGRFQDVRMSVLGRLHEMMGRQGLNDAVEYAALLGYGQAMETAVQAFTEGASCGPGPTRR